jgi:hypothetical protein
MFGKKKEKTWYDIAKKLQRKKKLEEPYASLFDYIKELTAEVPKTDFTLSHFLYFKHHDVIGDLDEVCENLSRILPPEFNENLDNAMLKYPLVRYRDNGDEIDEFEEEDGFAEEHSAELAAIMEKHINKIMMQIEAKKKTAK